MNHTVKGFGIGNKAEIDVFLELSCCFDNPTAATAKSLQSCPTLWDPIDGSPPGSAIPGILQARVLEWGAIVFFGNIRWIIEKARGVPEKYLFLLYWLCQSLWLCGSQLTVENSERDGNTGPPDLPLEKPVRRLGSNS